MKINTFVILLGIACASNPCGNGTCINGNPSGTDYICKCRVGFTGRNCEQCKQLNLHNQILIANDYITILSCKICNIRFFKSQTINSLTCAFNIF